MMNLEISKNIRQVEITAGDVKLKGTDKIQIGSNIVSLHPDGFQDVLKLVGLTQKTIKHLNETMEDGASGYALVQMIMKHLAERKQMKVKLVVDLSTNQVIRIVDSAEFGNTIPMETFSNLMEMVANHSNKIIMYDPVFMDSGTKVSVQVKWDQDIPLVFKGENVSVGKQFTYDMFGSLTVEDLVERLVCTNGMTGIVPAYGKELDPTNPSEWYNTVMKSLTNPNQEFIKYYEKLVLSAMQSNLSVAEYNMVKAHMAHWAQDAEKIKKVLGHEHWKTEYETRGINLSELTKEQLKNCPTPVNKWDAVNLMTDLSSHVYQSHVDGRTMRETQKLAGKFLKRTPDEDRFVYNVPVFKKTNKLEDLLIINEQ